MATSYDVRVNQTEVYEGQRVTTYKVRWTVGRKRFKSGFRTAAAAESFRSELVTASRKGEAFDVESGQPVSMRRFEREQSWFGFACEYVDMKWPRMSANSRRTIAETLLSVTVQLWSTSKGKPDDEVLRSALYFAYNKKRREDEEPSPELVPVLRWIERSTKPVSVLAEPLVVRQVLDSFTVRLDGEQSAPTVINRKRAGLFNALGYATELGYLESNPLESLKWKAPKASHAIDRRSVVSPMQARSLIEAVRVQSRSGPMLAGLFAVMYFAALRPEEAVNLRESNLVLPAEGWGDLHLERSAPHAGSWWTDSGGVRDERPLKHRAKGQTRVAPCPPELTAILHAHLERFGTDREGRLFRGEQGDAVSGATYGKAWRRARRGLFTDAVFASPLARRPYDLRHAAVSTWLNGGVHPTQVAEWAGHSVAVLLDVYAKCIDGQEDLARRRVEEALG